MATNVNYLTTNKFHVRPDYRRMAEKIATEEAKGNYNHGYMNIEDTIRLFGRGGVDPKSLYNMGFQSVNTPLLQQDEAEHKTGLQVYATKQGTGNSTLDNLTMEQGIITTEPYFAKLMLRALTGGATKLDIMVIHFDMNIFRGDASVLQLSEALEKYARIYIYEGCVPISSKVDGDLDATGGDIAIGELEFAASNLIMLYPRWNDQKQDFESVLMSSSLKIEDDIATIV